MTVDAVTRRFTEDDQALEIVKLGYGDNLPGYSWPDHDSRTLMFRVGFRSIEKACEAVDAIGQYNGFDPEKVKTALCLAGEIVDPENRGITAQYMIGREYSPVIYIPCWGSLGRLDDVREALAHGEPDELDIQENGYIRAWWD